VPLAEPHGIMSVAPRKPLLLRNEGFQSALIYHARKSSMAEVLILLRSSVALGDTAMAGRRWSSC